MCYNYALKKSLKILSFSPNGDLFQTDRKIQQWKLSTQTVNTSLLSLLSSLVSHLGNPLGLVKSEALLIRWNFATFPATISVCIQQLLEYYWKILLDNWKNKRYTFVDFRLDKSQGNQLLRTLFLGKLYSRPTSSSSRTKDSEIWTRSSWRSRFGQVVR